MLVGVLIFTAIIQVVLAFMCFAMFKAKAFLPAFGGVLFGFFFLVLSALSMSGLVLLNGIALAALGAVGLATGMRVNRFGAAAVGVSLAVLAVGVTHTALALREWSRLREEHPYQSLAERLGPAERAESGEPAAPVLLPETDTNLVVLEARLDLMDGQAIYRNRALEMTHASYVKQFVNAPGFGVGRRMIVRPEMIELDPPKSIPLPESTAPDPATPEPGADREPAPVIDAYPEPRELVDLHLFGTVDFANPKEFGHVVSVEKVAGFQPHAFRRMPALRQEDRPRWQVTKLELVSLLLHDEPAIYRSENLPRMDELQDVPVRRLDPFEAQALERLQVGEDVVIDESPNAIRMLGSIRAAKQCLQCHQVDRGYLLGAFTYLLRPAAFKPEPPRPEKPRI